jgi:hypothetical protein
VLSAGYHDTVRTLVYTGRPLRVKKNPYNVEWDTTRKQEQEKLLAQGIVPVQFDIDQAQAGDMKEIDPQRVADGRPLLMGQVWVGFLLFVMFLTVCAKRWLERLKTLSPPRRLWRTWSGLLRRCDLFVLFLYTSIVLCVHRTLLPHRPFGPMLRCSEASCDPIHTVLMLSSRRTIYSTSKQPPTERR